jgi:hypothetical protein
MMRINTTVEKAAIGKESQLYLYSVEDKEAAIFD